MKKVIILSLIFTLILVGVLYATYKQPAEVEPVTAEQVYMGQNSHAMPDVIPDPMVGFPLH